MWFQLLTLSRHVGGRIGPPTPGAMSSPKLGEVHSVVVLPTSVRPGVTKRSPAPRTQ
jgi:hypothetical protein